ncbi:MAG: TonB-dependent receptor plug domain-containing protein [Opitutales bacterium]
MKTVYFNVPEGKATSTLKEAARQADVDIVSAGRLLRKVETPAVKGEYAPREVFDLMLAGTSLAVFQHEKSGVYTIRKAAVAEYASGDSNPVSTTQMNENKKTIGGLLKGLLALAVASSSNLSAQDDSGEDKVFELSPFQVDTSNDSGYRATNTLSGSRLNSSLRDTAASVSVFTEEFVEDMGATGIDELLRYTMGSVISDGDDDKDTGLLSDSFNGTSTTTRIRTRGIESSKGMDYFENITPDDGYRVGRYDESRGPNGILFGISNAGGLTNQTSIVANTNRDSGRVRVRLDSNQGMRSEVRYNKVLMEDRLAMAIAALDQEGEGWRTGTFDDKERFFGAMTYKVNDSLVLRGNYETGRDFKALVKPMTIRDNALAWYDNFTALGGLNGGGAVLLKEPDGGDVSDAEFAAGLADAYNGTPRITYIENDGYAFNAANTYTTNSYNKNGVFAPDGSAGVTSAGLNLDDPSIFPYDYNLFSASFAGINTALENYTLSADYRITDNLFLNLSHNRQEVDIIATSQSKEHPYLRGDPNTFLGQVGDANEVGGEDNRDTYAGQLYIESEWIRDDRISNREETRVSLSYELDTERLGTHRIAAMASRSEGFDSRQAGYQALAGAPYNSNHANGRNKLRIRKYYKSIEDLAYSPIASFRDAPESVTVDGVVYPIVWGRRDTNSTANIASSRIIDSKMLVSQSHFLDRKLALTLGLREDEAKFTKYGHIDNDPLAGPRPDTSVVFSNSDESGQTSTVGAVYHLSERLSLVANQGSNIGMPNYIGAVLPTGDTPVASQGDGSDYGIAFNLMDNRLSGRLVYYTASSLQTTRFGNHRKVNQKIVDSVGLLAIGAGAHTEASWASHVTEQNLLPVWNSYYRDTKSEGYELQLTANITDNWRFNLNASKTDRLRSGVYSGEIDFFGLVNQDEGVLMKQGATELGRMWSVDSSAYDSNGAISQYIGILDGLGVGYDANTELAETSRPFGQDLWLLVNSINTRKQQEEKRWGLRPYNFNLYTAYDFKEGPLSGFTVGGGYRLQAPRIIGEDSNRVEQKGSARTTADLMLRYRTKVEGRFNGRLSFQVNVYNVLNDGPLDPVRLSATPDFYFPGGETATSRGIGYSWLNVVEPRSFRFTTTFDF